MDPRRLLDRRVDVSGGLTLGSDDAAPVRHSGFVHRVGVAIGGAAVAGRLSVLSATPAEPPKPDVDLVAPSVAARGPGPNRVFAHYFPPYPLSIDNQPTSRDYYTRQYLTINGENGKHRAYGGLLRDRPLGRGTRSGTWQIKDMRQEIRQAQAAGIDGFTLDVLGFSGRTWPTRSS